MVAVEAWRTAATREEESQRRLVGSCGCAGGLTTCGREEGGGGRRSEWLRRRSLLAEPPNREAPEGSARVLAHRSELVAAARDHAAAAPERAPSSRTLAFAALLACWPSSKPRLLHLSPPYARRAPTCRVPDHHRASGVMAFSRVGRARGGAHRVGGGLDRSWWLYGSVQGVSRAVESTRRAVRWTRGAARQLDLPRLAASLSLFLHHFLLS